MEILVGENYKEQFDSVYNLVNSCRTVFSNNYCAEIQDDRKYIRDANNQYYYEPKIKDIKFGSVKSDDEHDETANFPLNQDFDEYGAIWFRNLRAGAGAEINTANAVHQWNNFAETIAEKYHLAYALVQYKQESANKITYKDAFSITKVLIKTLYERDIDEEHFKDVNADASKVNLESTIDIYALSLRLAIYSGAGEAIRILGKVYLESNTSRAVFTPILKADAESIDKRLLEQKSEYKRDDSDNGNNSSETGNSQVVKAVLNALQRIVEDSNSNFDSAEAPKNIFDYFICSKEDFTKMDIMYKKAPGIPLSCRELKVLGISRFVWHISAYNCMFDKMPNLRATFGVNNSISLKCLSCSTDNEERYIVKDGEILLNDEAPVKSVTVSESGKYEPEQANLIKEFGVHNSHLKKITCSNIGLGDTCTCFRCENDYSQVVKDGNKTRMFCNNCYRPEVVSFYNKELVMTENMCFSYSDMEMIPKTSIDVCDICSRNIGKSGGHRCPDLCQKFRIIPNNSKLKKQAEECYDRYKGALPLRSRMNLEDKYALEDAGIVVFKIGKKYYKFDKLHADDNGKLLTPAEKVYPKSDIDRKENNTNGK